jgi:hypothetical protein
VTCDFVENIKDEMKKIFTSLSATISNNILYTDNIINTKIY